MDKVLTAAVTLILLLIQPAMAALNGGAVFSDANGTLSSQRGCIAIESYGGVADGKTLNDGALTVAIAVSDTANPGFPCVKFGVGTYRFGSAFSYTVALKGTIALLGEGSQLTKLQWAANKNGIQLTQSQFANTTFSTFHIRYLSITTEGTGNNSVGLSLSGYGQLAVYPTSDMIDVSFEGSDGHAGQNFWKAAIVINGWSAINISKGHILNGGTIQPGTVGILMTGSSTQQPSIINIDQLLIGYYDVGIQYGSYTQGVTINRTNILGCSYGVVVPSGQSGILSQLTFTNNQSNCSKAQIFVSTVVDPIQITGNLFESASGSGNAGVIMNVSRYSIINDNVFFGTGGSGLYVASSPSGATQIAADNIFAGFGTAINLGSATTGWTIHDNRLGGSACVGCSANNNYEHDDR